MDFRDVVKNGLDEYLERLKKAVDGLTPVELYWQPSPNSNHIAWLVWHMARVEDGWVNRYLRQAAQLWDTEGWAPRFRLSSARAGPTDSAEDVAAFPSIPLPDLLAYFDAVRQGTLTMLGSLTEDDLPTTRPSSNRPNPPTVSWVLAHLLVEEAQHLGQVAYLRGILRGLSR